MGLLRQRALQVEGKAGQIGALVRSARQGRWGWLLGILFFNWLAILIYLLITPPDIPIEAMPHG